jgi:hypothetical protein
MFPDIPWTVASDPEQLALWIRASAALKKVGREVNPTQLTLVCEAWKVWILAERDVEATGGPVLWDWEGRHYNNIYWGLSCEAREVLADLCDRAGLKLNLRGKYDA